MNTGKGYWASILTWTGVAAAIIAALIWVKQAERREDERLHPLKKEIREYQESHADTLPIVTAQTNHEVRAITRASMMTDEQKAEIARKFTEKFKPAVERWLSAYGSHVPFKAEDFTLDKFHSTVGSSMFTFMVTPDLTLTLNEANDNAKVVYMMSKAAAVKMNAVPQPGQQPDLKTPVARDEVTAMLKADSGVEFKPNEIIIRPSGKVGINGGAFVDVLPTGRDPNNALNYVVSAVFDSNGTLASYERDPRF